MAIPKIQPYALDTVKTNFTNKTDWSINPEKCVLLVHDMQKYFIDFYDKTQAPVSDMVANITQLKSLCQQQHIPVVYTAQPGNQNQSDRALLTDFWGPGLKDDSQATAIIDEIAPTGTDTCLTKWRYSAFQRTSLMDLMKEAGCNQLVICGVYAHIGILTTALEAFMNDIQVFVVSDAVADFSLAEHQMAIDYISQRCGFVTNMEGVMKQLSLPTQQNVSAHALTAESMRQDVASILMLPIEDVTLDDNLMFAGLDSVNMMRLVEQWKQHIPQLSFAALAEHSTIQAWYDTIKTLNVEPSDVV